MESIDQQAWILARQAMSILSIIGAAFFGGMTVFAIRNRGQSEFKRREWAYAGIGAVLGLVAYGGLIYIDAKNDLRNAHTVWKETFGNHEENAQFDLHKEVQMDATVVTIISVHNNDERYTGLRLKDSSGRELTKLVVVRDRDMFRKLPLQAGVRVTLRAHPKHVLGKHLEATSVTLLN